MDKIPDGYKVEKANGFPVEIQDRIEGLSVKWEWLRAKLRKMQDGEIIKLYCPNEKDMIKAQTAVKNFSMKEAKDMPPALARKYLAYTTKLEAKGNFILYIQCLPPKPQ